VWRSLPTRALQAGRRTLRRLLGEFKERGGEALEVVTGNHTEDQSRYFAGMSKAFGLAASRGSDYHGPGRELRVCRGACRRCPRGSRRLWELWAE